MNILLWKIWRNIPLIGIWFRWRNIKDVNTIQKLLLDKKQSKKQVLPLWQILRISFLWLPLLQYFSRLAWLQFEACNSDTLGGAIQFYYSEVLKEVQCARPFIYEINVLDLLPASVLIFVTYSLLYVGIYYYLTRPTHIITRFEFPKDEPALQDIANSLTHSFANHMKSIGELLSLRQVERISQTFENSFPLFLTSVHDEEFIQQLRTLSSFEAANVKVPLGGLVALLILNSARTRVKGNIQRGEDGTIQVWVESFQRGKGGNVKAVSQNIPSTLAGFVDQHKLDEISYDIAVNMAHKLGQTAQIASTPESLKLLLLGLKASSERNWWYAIWCYRRATEHEERTKSVYGLGRYQIGATLLSQGLPSQAIEHLLKAISSQPAIPEAYYSLALATVIQNAEQTKEVQGSVPEPLRQAELWLEEAKRIKPDFPEVSYLLGIISYQRGKRLEREQSLRFPAMERNHLNAAGHFLRSIADYDRNLQIAKNRSDNLQSIRERMLILHALADALRSLRCYGQAVWLYEQVRSVLPGNMHNLIDTAMTFCLQKEWQTAYDYIGKYILITPQGRLNADANLYCGWAAAGLAIQKDSSEYLFQALMRLDFAITLRPRFISRRQQTEWTGTWKEALQYFGNEEKHETTRWMESINKNGITISSIGVIGDWLAWKFVTNQYLQMLGGLNEIDMQSEKEWLLDRLIKRRIVEPKQTLEQNIKLYLPYKSPLGVALHYYTLFYYYTFLFSSTSIEMVEPPYPPINSYYSCHRKLKMAYAQLLHHGDITLRAISNEQIEGRLKLLPQAISNWQGLLQKVLNFFENLSSISPKIQYDQRWTAEIFLESTCLLCRMLGETNAFTELLMVSAIAGRIAKRWFELWKLRFDNFRFSTLVMRYRYVSILSWHALALQYVSEATKQKLQKWKPFDNMQVIQVKENYGLWEENLWKWDMKEIESEIRSRSHAFEPLLAYIKGIEHRSAERFELAVDEFNSILNYVESFDPRVFEQVGVGVALTQDLDSLQVPNKELIKEKPRTQLYYMERVSGRQEFEQYIDKPRIYEQLAETFSSKGDYQSSVTHLMDALTWSPYLDSDMENFLKLAQNMARLDRFQEALAIIYEALDKLGSVRDLEEKYLLEKQFRVQECILLTRLERYSEALDKGLILLNYHFPNTEKSRSMPPKVPKLKDIKRDHTQQVWDNLTKLFAWAIKLNPLYNPIMVWGIRSQISDWMNGFQKYEFDFAQYMYMYSSTTGLRENILHLSINKVAYTTTYEQFEICKQTLTLLLLICEVYNNMAYNMAKLNVDLAQAENYISVANTVMEHIRNAALSVKSKRKIIDDIDDRIARFWDTRAWIYYRKHIKEVDSMWDTSLPLQNAGYYLSDKAIKYDFGLAVPHYHLARVHLAMCEDITNKTAKNEHDITKVAPQLTHHLKRAFHHWSVAVKLDTNRRLDAKLRELRQRLDLYNRRWDNTQTALLLHLEQETTKPK